MKRSIVQARGRTRFPQHTGERIHMREFYKDTGLPPELARWQHTVDAMLDGVDSDGPIYLMVDQGLVRAGNPHRRPGVHIDGHWNPAIQAHSSSGHGMPAPVPASPHGGHGMPSSPPGRHSGPEPLPIKRDPGMPAAPKPKKPKEPPEQDTRDIPTTLPDIMFMPRMEEGLILTSDIAACRAYDGLWTGDPEDDGDCSRIDLSATRALLLAPGLVYAGNVTMLHESLPVPFDCLRTVVRLNVPGWTPA